MKYQLSRLQLFATPNAEKMFEFKGLPQVEFEFPGIVRTALLINCGLLRVSRYGGEIHSHQAKSLIPLKYKSYISSLRDDLLFFLCLYYKHPVPNGTRFLKIAILWKNQL